ncbi:tRNA uridine-5-carboxymethylaminomethyl(34) synthesis GTPase MnmE [Minwuia sp. IMCC3077]|uniref:tRNA uridine-5-carboxymethylaminomethyl(34) synthesis GTPase MnmE n=1 Tax=unclassified Minwuia TaxID=2618799 RepID=UPI0032AFA148
MSSADTIHALSSAPGPAGVAVVRLSGPATRAALIAFAGDLPSPRRAALRTLNDPATGEVLDRGLVLWFPAPNSYTGEDLAELHVHGGRAVLDGLFRALAAQPGLRTAEAGEFTRRAVANGKLDLTAAEGIGDLIAAETAAQRRQALRQADGHLADLYQGWSADLVAVLAWMEAWLDFPDEDLPDSLVPETTARLAALRGHIAGHLAEARQGERVRTGLQVAIVGAPNAGKSTLLNALAQRDVAIVTAEPGTTRDVLEVQLDLGGHAVTLLDTAGLRETENAVEREGIRRARERAGSADVVVHLVAAGTHSAPLELARAAPGEPAPPVISVRSKVDLPHDPEPQDMVSSSVIDLSVMSGEGLPVLLRRLTDMARDLTETGGSVPPTRWRHRESLAHTVAALDRAQEGLSNGLPLELVGEDLRMAIRALGRITGKVDVEDLLDVIFRDFCIGK